MDYTMLTTADRLALARDTLRGRESDYFRLSLLDEQSRGGGDRLSTMEAEIGNIRKEVEALTQQVQAEDAEVQVDPDAPSKEPDAPAVEPDTPDAPTEEAAKKPARKRTARKKTANDPPPHAGVEPVKAPKDA